MIKNYVSPFLILEKTTIIDIGEEDFASMTQKPPTQRLHYVLHFVVSGEGVFSYSFNNKLTQIPIRKGQIFCLYKNISVSYQSMQDKPLYYFWIGFDSECGDDIMRYIGISPNNPVCSVPDNQQIIDLFHALFHSWKIKKLYSVWENFFRLLNILHKENAVSNETLELTSQNQLSLNAKKYIDGNIYKNISVNDVAESLNVTRNHLSRSFKREYSITPQEYIRRMRINAAHHLLKSTNYRISEISDLLNFPDIYTFSKFFKKYYGKSPLNFRNDS